MVNAFLKFIEKHPWIILCIVLIITLFFGFHAKDIQLNADYSMFLASGNGDEVYKGGTGDYQPSETIALSNDENTTVYTTVFGSGNMVASAGTQFIPQEEEDYDYGASYLVLVEADNLYDPEILNALERSIKKFCEKREVGIPFSVFDFVTLEKKGSRLATVPVSTHQYGDDSWTAEEAAALEARIKADPNLKYYLVSADSNSMLFDFPIGGINNEMLDSFPSYFEDFIEAGGRIYVNGGAVINAKVMHYLQRDLVTLVSLCLITILVTFYFSFRSKRSVLLPASLSVIGLIWTIGTMKLLGFQITLLNIVTPCMVLNLGSAYSIHVISEYYSSCALGGSFSPVLSVKKILKTILLACVTTICGFLCLIVSDTGGLREFGYSVSIGIGYCAILACTYLPAVLAVIPTPKQDKVEKQKNSLMVRFVNQISIFVPKYWYILLIILVLLFFGFILVKDKISLDSNYMSYFPKSDPFGQESRHLAEKIGGTNPFYITIKAPEGVSRFFLESENLSKVWEFQEKLTTGSDDVLQILSYPSYVDFANYTMTGEHGIPENKGLAMLISRLILLLQNQVGGQLSMILNADATEMTMIMQHWDSVNEDLMTTSSIARVKQMIIDNLPLLPNGTTVTIHGDPIKNLNFANQLFDDQNKSTILSVLIVFLIASFAFLSMFKGFYSIIPVLAGICINYIFMFLAGIPFDVVTVSFTSIAIGCGVDDALHFILRYRNIGKLEKGLSTSRIISDTIKQTGKPIILSTVSVVCGMMMLSFASYTPIRYFGLLMSVTLFGCMVSTILFLPPMIILGDKLSGKIRKK